MAWTHPRYSMIRSTSWRLLARRKDSGSSRPDPRHSCRSRGEVSILPDSSSPSARSPRSAQPRVACLRTPRRQNVGGRHLEPPGVQHEPGALIPADLAPPGITPLRRLGILEYLDVILREVDDPVRRDASGRVEALLGAPIEVHGAIGDLDHRHHVRWTRVTVGKVLGSSTHDREVRFRLVDARQRERKLTPRVGLVAAHFPRRCCPRARGGGRDRTGRGGNRGRGGARPQRRTRGWTLNPR